MDLISIIVPIYNAEKVIKRCIESISRQSYEMLEIILVDDGSTDQSLEICEDMSEKDSRIKIIHQNNGGVSRARNTGLKKATGQYIMPVRQHYARLRYGNAIDTQNKILIRKYFKELKRIKRPTLRELGLYIKKMVFR